MSRIKPRIKNVPLAFMGTEWAECSINFSCLLWQDVKDISPDKVDNQQAVERVVGLLGAHFLDGTGIGLDGETIQLKAEDLADFDLESQAQIFKLLSGSNDPNA